MKSAVTLACLTASVPGCTTNYRIKSALCNPPGVEDAKAGAIAPIEARTLRIQTGTGKTCLKRFSGIDAVAGRAPLRAGWPWQGIRANIGVK